MSNINYSVENFDNHGTPTCGGFTLPTFVDKMCPERPTEITNIGEFTEKRDALLESYQKKFGELSTNNDKICLLKNLANIIKDNDKQIKEW